MLHKKHIFVYLVDFLLVFTPRQISPRSLWRLSVLKQNLKKREKPSAFVLKELMVTENLFK